MSPIQERERTDIISPNEDIQPEPQHVDILPLNEDAQHTTEDMAIQLSREFLEHCSIEGFTVELECILHSEHSTAILCELYLHPIVYNFAHYSWITICNSRNDTTIDARQRISDMFDFITGHALEQGVINNLRMILEKSNEYIDTH